MLSTVIVVRVGLVFTSTTFPLVPSKTSATRPVPIPKIAFAVKTTSTAGVTAHPFKAKFVSPKLIILYLVWSIILLAAIDSLIAAALVSVAVKTSPTALSVLPPTKSNGVGRAPKTVI